MAVADTSGTVHDWLRSLNLADALLEPFMANGFRTMSACVHLSDADLVRFDVMMLIVGKNGSENRAQTTHYDGC